MMAAPHTVVDPMPLPQLLQSDAPELAGIAISDVELDSRRVAPGGLFIALSGEVHDGRQFIEQAVASGASAVVAEPPVEGFVDAMPVPVIEVPELRSEAGQIAARFYRHPSQHMYAVGTTGTNGKTTTSRLLGQLARAQGKPCGVIGTLGASLDDEIQESSNTTPDAVSLQRQLAQWRQQGVSMVSMEVSSHALVQERVSGMQFDTAIFTNLSHDHLDYHRSMADYGRAKLRLFSMDGLQYALVNIDDEFSPLVAASLPGDVRLLTYSAAGAAADIRVENAQFHAGGVYGRLHTPWGSGDLSSPLWGRFNLANLAAAIGALLLAGEEFAALLRAASEVLPVPGRMERVDNDHSLQVIVDYAHTPDALEQILASLSAHLSGRLITVFGCGGDRDNNKRPVMGRVACAASDMVFVTSDNPRNEDPLQILADITEGCVGDFELIADRAEAIARALDYAQPGDCVVIAGKGHEDYQLVAGERRHFSDVEQVREILARRVAS